MSCLVNIKKIDSYIADLVEDDPAQYINLYSVVLDRLCDSESDLTPGNKWDVFHVDDPTNDAIDHMEQLLSKYGYLTVDLDYIPVGREFIICLTADGLRIIDDNVDARTGSHRSFDMECLRKFIMSPSIEEWNKMWLCNEKRDPPEIYDKGIYLTYASYDRSRQRKMYRNGIEIV